MFFIGGINSVLPFILYVSLIWICMVIGFGNKLNVLLHSQVFPARSVQKDKPAITVTTFILTPETDLQTLRIKNKRGHCAGLSEETRPMASMVTCLEKVCLTQHPIESLSFPNAYRGPPAG